MTKSSNLKQAVASSTNRNFGLALCPFALHGTFALNTISPPDRTGQQFQNQDSSSPP